MLGMADRIMEMVRRRHALGEVRDSAGVAGDDGDADNFCPLRPLYALAMDHLIVCVEQLDRATDELADGSAIAGRLALILIDNVVELLMHRHCKDIFQREAGFDPDPAKPGRYSRAARVRVLGQRFDEKYKFLLREGDLSQQELDFIRICHDIRGEAYHAGLTHDAFIRSLAAEYHALACSLIARLQVSWRTSSSIDQYGPRVEKHLCTGPGRLGDRYLCTPIEDMAVSLNASRSPLDIRLQDALADALSSRLDSIEASLQFLVDSTPDGKGSAEDELIEAQRWADLFSGVPLDVQERTDEYGAYVLRRRKEMDASWEPKLRALPMTSWRARAESTRGATTMSALTRYEQLSRDIEHIEGVLDSTASALSSHIDMQSDAARVNWPEPKDS